MLWNEKDKIKNFSSSVLCGNEDVVFQAKQLEKWATVLNDLEIHKLDNIGHFV